MGPFPHHKTAFLEASLNDSKLKIVHERAVDDKHRDPPAIVEYQRRLPDSKDTLDGSPGCCSFQNWTWFLELTSGCAASWEVGVEDRAGFQEFLN